MTLEGTKRATQDKPLRLKVGRGQGGSSYQRAQRAILSFSRRESQETSRTEGGANMVRVSSAGQRQHQTCAATV